MPHNLSSTTRVWTSEVAQPMIRMWIKLTFLRCCVMGRRPKAGPEQNRVWQNQQLWSGAGLGQLPFRSLPICVRSGHVLMGIKSRQMEKTDQDSQWVEQLGLFGVCVTWRLICCSQRLAMGTLWSCSLLSPRFAHIPQIFLVEVQKPQYFRVWLDSEWEWESSA